MNRLQSAILYLKLITPAMAQLASLFILAAVFINLYSGEEAKALVLSIVLVASELSVMNSKS